MFVQPVTPTPMDALLAKVDAVLLGTGADPTAMCADDKILLAVQYIEIQDVIGLLGNRAAAEKVYRL